MKTILKSIVNLIGRPTWKFNDQKNLHVDNKQDIHVNSKNHEESDYSLDMDLLTISYSHVSYPKRSGLIGRRGTN